LASLAENPAVELSPMKRTPLRLFNGFAAVSMLLFIGSAINIGANHGSNSAPRGIQIGLPLPSDADEILVIGFSNVEYWEFTPWDNKWYLMSGGPLVTILLGILPGVWVLRHLIGKWQS
jgi:hypothetical protein